VNLAIGVILDHLCLAGIMVAVESVDARFLANSQSKILHDSHVILLVAPLVHNLTTRVTTGGGGEAFRIEK
jgi:hypothetical protein